MFFASAVANRFKPSQTIAKIYQTAILDGNDVHSVISDIRSGKSEKHDRHEYYPEKQMKNNYSLEFTIRTSVELLEETDIFVVAERMQLPVRILMN